MNRTGRALTLGCLLLLQPLLALAEGGNSLLIPATGRCTLNVQPEDLANALKACEQTASRSSNWASTTTRKPPRT